MPSKSAKQAKFMRACAHGMKSKNCPPKRVAQEFVRADQARSRRRKRR